MDKACPTPPPSARQQRWFVAALLLVFLIASIQYTVKITARDDRPAVSEDSSKRSAILRWRDELLELDQGHNIWDKHLYPNPPIMAILLRPIADLPPQVGALLWFSLKVVMALVCMAWSFRIVQDAQLPFPPWAKVLTVILALRPILGDLSHGNVNLFILFLVIGGLYAYRNRWEVTGGLAIGLAIACKVTPALFLPYFAWKRSWKTLAGCALGLVLFFEVVPGLWLGFDRNHQDLASWANNMARPFIVEGRVFYSEHNNQSLPGLALRMLSHSPSFTNAADNTPLEYHNLLNVSPELVGWIIRGCMGVFALLVVWCCRTPTAQRQTWPLAAEFSLVLLGMLLFSERTWKHHCVTLLLPFAVLCYYLWAARPTRILRGYVLSTLVLVTVLMTLTSTGKPLGDEMGKLAQVYGAYVWAYLLLAGALVVMLRTHAAQVAALSPTATLPYDASRSARSPAA